MTEPEFTFLEPGPLIEDDLELVLVEKIPGEPSERWVPSYTFEMRSTLHHVPMGYINLRIGHHDSLVRFAGHVGYGVEPDYRGGGYAARSIRLLLPFAGRHGLKSLWITCDPENKASRRTCETAGGVLREIVDIPEEHELYKDGFRRKCRYELPLPG